MNRFAVCFIAATVATLALFLTGKSVAIDQAIGCTAMAFSALAFCYDEFA